MIGAHLDGLPDGGVPVCLLDRDVPSHVGTPRTLFEQDYCERAVALSELLGAESAEEIYRLSRLDEDCDAVYVVIDYVIRSLGSVPESFFWKRTRQACELYASYASSRRTYLAIDSRSGGSIA